MDAQLLEAARRDREARLMRSQQRSFRRPKRVTVRKAPPQPSSSATASATASIEAPLGGSSISSASSGAAAAIRAKDLAEARQLYREELRRVSRHVFFGHDLFESIRVLDAPERYSRTLVHACEEEIRCFRGGRI